MTILLASTVALLSAPQLLSVGPTFPITDENGGKSAAALIEVVVDPDGEVVNCRTLEVFGDAELGEMICKLQWTAEFKNAVSETGEPSYGIARALVKYIYVGSSEAMAIDSLEAPGMTFEVVGAKLKATSFPGSPPRDLQIDQNIEVERYSGDPQLVLRPDITLEVETLPHVGTRFRDERIVVNIGKDGRIANCAAADIGETPIKSSAYTQAACQSVEGMRISPLMIEDQATNYVRTLDIRFALPSIE